MSQTMNRTVPFQKQKQFIVEIHTSKDDTFSFRNLSMSDWTYEMLRYAFSWNDESSEKALKYVVTGRSPSDSMSEFQMPGSRVISSEGVENPEN